MNVAEVSVFHQSSPLRDITIHFNVLIMSISKSLKDLLTHMICRWLLLLSSFTVHVRRRAISVGSINVKQLIASLIPIISVLDFSTADGASPRSKAYLIGTFNAVLQTQLSIKADKMLRLKTNLTPIFF